MRTKNLRVQRGPDQNPLVCLRRKSQPWQSASPSSRQGTRRPPSSGDGCCGWRWVRLMTGLLLRDPFRGGRVTCTSSSCRGSGEYVSSVGAILGTVLPGTGSKLESSRVTRVNAGNAVQTTIISSINRFSRYSMSYFYDNSLSDYSLMV